jgi:hypothetical protein
MTTHGVAWMDDPAFVEAYRESRVLTACWAAFDEFARTHDVRILALRTGHGLLIKPYVSR